MIKKCCASQVIVKKVKDSLILILNHQNLTLTLTGLGPRVENIT